MEAFSAWLEGDKYYVMTAQPGVWLHGRPEVGGGSASGGAAATAAAVGKTSADTL